MATVLSSPKLPNGLPTHAQWLAGEGAGSWFVLEPARHTEAMYNMDRYDAEGHLECRGLFIPDAHSERFDARKPYTITYKSHCARVTVLQDGQVFTLNPFPEELLP